MLLSDRRICSSARPQAGVYLRDVARVTSPSSGFLGEATLEVGGLKLSFHTRSVRDAFGDAVAGGAAAFRGSLPERD